MSSKTLHLVDPQLLDFLEQYPAQAITEETVQAWRTAGPAIEDAVPEMGVQLAELAVEGPAGVAAIGLRVYRPLQPERGVGCILHVHGGGFMGGGAAALERLDRTLCHELGCVVATVDYRLAPETRYPGSLDDCHAALSWVFAHAGELGVDRSRIGVMGESAGGGLAAALALRTRDEGMLQLAFQHLRYPMIDDRTGVSRDPNPCTGEFVWTRQNNAFAWSALLGEPAGSEHVPAYAAPARAAVLEGLPPAYIAVGALDLFVDEDVEYAQRLMRAGVPTELHVYPGAVHVFDFHPSAEIARRARCDSLAALARFLGRSLQERPVAEGSDSATRG
jgi:acetyl esterase/lipase